MKIVYDLAQEIKQMIKEFFKKLFRKNKKIEVEQVEQEVVEEVVECEHDFYTVKSTITRGDSGKLLLIETKKCLKCDEEMEVSTEDTN